MEHFYIEEVKDYGDAGFLSNLAPWNVSVTLKDENQKTVWWGWFPDIITARIASIAVMNELYERQMQ